MKRNNADDLVYVPAAVRKAYPEFKFKAKMRRAELDPYVDALNDELTEVWNAENEAVYAPLRRKKLRVEARARRDKTRVRKFSHKQPHTSKS